MTSRKLPKHVLEVLKEARTHLLEHDRDYHHMTPKELLAKIEKILEDNTTTKAEKP